MKINPIKLLVPFFLLSSLWLSSQALASDWIYSARQGDTLWDICLTYTNKRGCWLKLGQYNQIENDRAIPIGTTVRIPTAWLSTPPAVGVVTEVSGESSYAHRISGQRNVLSRGAIIHLGARVTTSKGAVRIRLGDHSELLIRPDSQLVFDSLTTGSEMKQQAEVTLQRGEVDTQVKPNRNTRFQITTPAAIAAVRGTRYRVASASKDAMRAEVVSGLVAVDTDRGKAQVPAGYGIQAQHGEPLGPTTQLLPAPQLSAAHIDAPLPILLQWNSPPEARRWRIDLSSSQGATALLSTHTTTEPQLAFTTLALGCYVAKIHAIDANGFTGLEATQTFCAIPEPPAAPPPPPVDNAPPWALVLTAFAWLAIIAL